MLNPACIRLAGVLAVCLAWPAAGAVSTATHTSANCGFPDSSQTVCYNDTGLIGCPTLGLAFYGQDANFTSSAGKPSYTLHNKTGGGMCTVDNRTGLMWASTGSNNGNPVPSWAAALSICENSNFAGYSDWRLPNVRELASILDYGASGGPYIDLRAFPGAQSAYYWSSTTNPTLPTYAWSVSFYDSLVGGEDKTTVTINHVMCVRGGPP